MHETRRCPPVSWLAMTPPRSAARPCRQGPALNQETGGQRRAPSFGCAPLSPAGAGAGRGEHTSTGRRLADWFQGDGRGVHEPAGLAVRGGIEENWLCAPPWPGCAPLATCAIVTCAFATYTLRHLHPSPPKTSHLHPSPPAPSPPAPQPNEGGRSPPAAWTGRQGRWGWRRRTAGNLEQGRPIPQHTGY